MTYVPFLHRLQIGLRWTVVSAVLLGLMSTSCAMPLGANTEASYQQKLAEHLTVQDARMYGAYWCPHCATQKEMFGRAAKAIPYIECDPKGQDAQPQLCRDKDIEGYPTWEIDGAFYPGARPLSELARLSNFQEK